MRERLRELGGSLSIKSYGQGCSVIASMPLTAAQQPQAESTNDAFHLPHEPIGHIGRVLIVDDHEVIRRGVKSLIEGKPDLNICGEASSVGEAMELLDRLRPDVALLDLRLGGESGWIITAKVRRDHLPTRLIVFSQYDQPAAMFTAKAAGCYGFDSKARASEDLIIAIRMVLAGETFFEPNKLATSA